MTNALTSCVAGVIITTTSAWGRLTTDRRQWTTFVLLTAQRNISMQNSSQKENAHTVRKYVCIHHSLWAWHGCSLWLLVWSLQFLLYKLSTDQRRSLLIDKPLTLCPWGQEWLESIIISTSSTQSGAHAHGKFVFQRTFSGKTIESDRFQLQPEICGLVLILSNDLKPSDCCF